MQAVARRVVESMTKYRRRCPDRSRGVERDLGKGAQGIWMLYIKGCNRCMGAKVRPEGSSRDGRVKNSVISLFFHK